MNELDQVSFKTSADESAKLAQGNVPAARAPQERWSRLLPLAILFSLVALAAVAWLAWDAQTRSERSGISPKPKDTETQGAVTFKQLQQQLADSQNRIDQLESSLADMQSQQSALNEMYRDMARAPDDWLLAEVEQTINIAAQQLQLAGDVRAAIMALQIADSRLARAGKVQAPQLRRALNQDLERLKSLPLVDTAGIGIKLDTLAALVNSLPLAVSALSPSTRAPERVHSPGEGWLTRVTGDMLDEFRQLVRISEINSSDVPLLAPGQGYFLRENLRLRLLSARLALLAHDEASYREDLKQARNWIGRYFDPKAKASLSAMATLRQLQENNISIATPNINNSLDAIRQARTAREKPVR